MGRNLLLDELSFYGAYHHNKWNQLIHFIFVPCIMFSMSVWLAYTGPLLPEHVWAPVASKPPGAIARFVVPNGALLMYAAFSAFYLFLDFPAGLTWSLFIGAPTWVGSTAFRMLVPNAWRWALMLKAFSWYMQIHPGHALLEKRKPALLDNVVQAFALAPLFVWFELLFLLGYRPQLRKELNNRVGKEIAAHRHAQAAKKAAKAQ